MTTLTIDDLRMFVDTTYERTKESSDRHRRTAIRALIDTTPEIGPLLRGDLANEDVRANVETLFLDRTYLSEATAKNYIGYFRSAIRLALAMGAGGHDITDTYEHPEPEPEPELVEPEPDPIDGDVLPAVAEVTQYVSRLTTDDYVEVDIPIRDHIRVTVPLPVDLTRSEAERIARIVTAYAVDG